MVFDHHEVGLVVLRVHAAARIADDLDLAAQRLHDADRESDLLEGIPLVEVKAAFHRQDGLPAQASAQKSPCVRYHGGAREMRDIVIGNSFVRFDILRQPAQPGAQDNANAQACADQRFRITPVAASICSKSSVTANGRNQESGIRNQGADGFLAAG